MPFQTLTVHFERYFTQTQALPIIGATTCKTCHAPLMEKKQQPHAALDRVKTKPGHGSNLATGKSQNECRALPTFAVERNGSAMLRDNPAGDG